MAEPTRRLPTIDVWEPDATRDPGDVVADGERPMLIFERGHWTLHIPNDGSPVEEIVGGFAAHEVDGASAAAVDSYEEWLFDQIVDPLADEQ